MKHLELIAEGIDVSGIVAEIEAQPELWCQNDWRLRPQGPHAESQDIWVRYNDPAILDIDQDSFNDEHVPVWYPAWKKLPSLRPVIFDLMARVQGEMLCGVLITRIPPGKCIKPHIDVGWHVDYTTKFYLSLKSKPGADFVLDYADGRVVLNPKVGECWRIDNRQRHWVTNASDDDRMTLIVCIRTDMFGG